VKGIKEREIIQTRGTSPAKALVAQRKNTKLLNVACSLRAFLCAFAGDFLSIYHARRGKLFRREQLFIILFA
jgi:hypothetical protein